MSSTAGLRAFAASLRRLPMVVAIKVAKRAAPALTEAAQASFAAGESPYGDGWEPGADGRRVTLRKTGALASGVRYVAIGTRIRLALTTAYAKYQVVRRPVTPPNGGPLPEAYADALARATAEVIREELAS